MSTLDRRPPGPAALPSSPEAPVRALLVLASALAVLVLGLAVWVHSASSGLARVGEPDGHLGDRTALVSGAGSRR